MENHGTVMTSELLKQNYYENDNSFYANGITLTCVDLARRESIRKYNVDENLVFCEDINIVFSTQPENIYFRKHNLNYNRKACEYCCVTKEAEFAEYSIKQILKNENIVVFRTATDYLKAFSWYRTEEPYIQTSHWAIIIGYDQQDYFFVDVPGMRNTKYFRPHPQNPSVGCIDKKDLQRAFQICCEVGYMNVNPDRIVGLEKILTGIVQSFYCTNTENNAIYVGKQALEALAAMLKKNLSISVFDWFDLEVLASRYDILKTNLHRYPLLKEQEQSIFLLEELAGKWRVFKNVMVKHAYSPQSNTGEKLANVIEAEILPMAEELVHNLEKNI